jgi:hypothetical protein
LFQILEFDIHDIQRPNEGSSLSLLETTTKGMKPAIIHTSESGYPKRIFKHFRQDNVRINVNKICRMLSYYGDQNILFEHFLKIIHNPEAKRNRKQALYILNEMYLGVAGIGIENEIQSITLPTLHTPSTVVAPAVIRKIIEDDQVDNLLDEYFEPNIWNIPTTNTAMISNTQEAQSLTIEELNDSIRLITRLANSHRYYTAKLAPRRSW